MVYKNGADVNQVLSKTLEIYNRGKRNDGIFTFNFGNFVFQPVGNAFYVHPTEFTNEHEKLLPLKPVLATKVALSANQQPVSEILKRLCAALAAQTGRRVQVGQLPPESQRVLSYTGKSRPAVEHLAALSKLLADNVSWQLLYEPHEKGFVLNAHIIGEK